MTDGFNAFGKPVPLSRKTSALKHLRAMGVTDSEETWECIGKMSAAIERDQPYEAMQVGMKHVDLTGAYRLMAVLCTDERKAEAAS